MSAETDHLQAILAERAHAYRARAGDGAGVGPQGWARDFLVLQLEAFRFGLRLDRIHGLIAYPAVTVVPHMPKAHLGVFSLRGNVHDAFCLSELYGAPTGENNFLLLLKSAKALVGFSIQSVVGVEAFSEENAAVIEDADWPAWLPKKLRGDIFMLNSDLVFEQLDQLTI